MKILNIRKCVHFKEILEYLHKPSMAKNSIPAASIINELRLAEETKKVDMKF